MADRVLRGSRLGAVRYETDRNHDLAAGQVARTAPRTVRNSTSVPPTRDPGTWRAATAGGTLLE